MCEIASYINSLKNHAEKSLVRGKFLLSTGEISDFWIDINEFLTPDIINAMIITMSNFLENCYRTYGPFSLVTPSYTEASEKTFPLRLIVNSAIDGLKDKTQIHSILAVQEKSSCRFTLDGQPKDPCILVIGVSVHISILIGILQALQQLGHKVQYVYTFICREKTSMNILSKKNIPLIPVVIALENTGKVFSLLEVDNISDQQYHSLAIFKHLVC
jgi:hypothetical protein